MDANPFPVAGPIRVGISACLLGETVRFDGGHKRNSFLTEVLGPHVEWVPVCPEVEMGLGTPRETLQLVRCPGGLRMVTTPTGIDHTDAMNRWADQRLESLAAEAPDLCGYVLKKDSPSCGLERVMTFSGNGVPEPDGQGLFAAALLKRFPTLPVEEEGRLADRDRREHFIERIFAARRIKDLFAAPWTQGTLVRFHTAHKMTLLSHSTTKYRELGRLVANGRAMPAPELRDAYERLFTATVAVAPTRTRHTNVLMHMAGHLKHALDSGAKRELLQSIEEYRLGLLPLAVPVSLLRDHVRVHDIAYLAGQTYLEPYPRDLMRRRHE